MGGREAKQRQDVDVQRQFHLKKHEDDDDESPEDGDLPTIPVDHVIKTSVTIITLLGIK